MIVKPKLRRNFTQVSNEIINHESLSNNAKLLCIKILSLPDNWKINSKHLGDFLGLSARSANRYLKELIDEGIFQKIQEIDGNNAKFTQNFTIIFKSSDDDEAEIATEIESPKNSDSKSQSMESDGFAQATGEEKAENSASETRDKNPTSVPLSPIYNIREFFSNKKFLYQLQKKFSHDDKKVLLFFQGIKVKKENLDFKSLSSAEIEKLKAWFEYKRLNNKPLKTISKNKLISKCLKFKAQNESVIAIIDRAIENGWAGLWGFKNANKKYPKTRLGKEMEEKAIIRAVLEQEPDFDGGEDYDLSRVRVNGKCVKWLKDENKFVLVG